MFISELEVIRDHLTDVNQKTKQKIEELENMTDYKSNKRKGSMLEAETSQKQPITKQRRVQTNKTLLKH